MKEFEVLESPLESEEKQHIADMHSVINLISVIASVLTLLDNQVSRRNRELDGLFNELLDVSQAIREKDSVWYALQRIKDSKLVVLKLVDRVIQETSGEENATAREAYTNLLSIYEIARERIAELELRSEDPDLKVEIGVPEMKRKFMKVFLAIERNSRGLYKIRYNLALKEERDYYLDLKIESNRKDRRLHIPLRLIDVMRDLTANSRKYTNPGGRIALALAQDEDMIRCRIEDNGVGIPEDELDRVVEFGYRATNVQHKNTKGGGFGLSKAAWLILSWGGTFSIASDVDKGSVFKISIPCDLTNHRPKVITGNKSLALNV